MSADEGSTRGDGGGWARRRRDHQKTSAASKARPTTPPTTPPAIAPAFDELELELVGADVDEAELRDVLEVALDVDVD